MWGTWRHSSGWMCVFWGCGKHLMLNVGTDITWPVIRQPIQSNPVYWGPAVGLFRNPDSRIKCCGCNVWTVPGVSSYCSVNPQPGGHRLPLSLPVLESWSQHRSVGMPTVCVCTCVTTLQYIWEHKHQASLHSVGNSVIPKSRLF